MERELRDALTAAAVREEGSLVLPLQRARELAARFRLSGLQVAVRALELGIVPARYQRNIGTLGMEGQLRLLRSCVGVCGLGGLGGCVTEFLARYGVGRLILADPDVFEENNLNRQLLCRECDIGRPKALRARERVAEIDPDLEVSAHRCFVTADNFDEVFGEAQVVVDALDTVSSRLALEEGCARLGIPMVHGAIAGNAGQVMTIYPGDPGLRSLYAPGEDRGIELVEGNPPTTPALVAALQAQEVAKVLCGGEAIRSGFLFLDTSCNLFQFIPLR
ncbi:MAG: HesA/MoeB/ThiF family protein [Actinobacteria bacterium]|nr:HesA/MoeB/ThiF family protein [Actinomycetota bacterium]